MRKLILSTFMLFSFFMSENVKSDSIAYDFTFNGLEGNTINFKDFEGKVIVVVNVASRCGYTPQYSDLQEMWQNYKDQDLVIVGVPTNNFKQEPGSNKDIKKFCQTNFNIDFPMTEKINVIGKDAHPFYKWAKQTYGIGAIPKWNFHKIIINKKGKVVNTFASFTKPSSSKFINAIEKEIKS